MSKVDVTVTERPVQPTSKTSFPWGKKTHIPDPEVVSVHDDEDPEFILPKISSLTVVIMTNVLLQITFFIIVPSSELYAERLGGGQTFSGLVVGIPAAISALVLLPLMRYDRGGYKIPLQICCFAAIIGNLCHGLALKADFLYLILIGRIITGASFAFLMYAKKYCSDPRIVGIRRRTTLAAYLVIGQASGVSLGPFLGGVLYKIGFGDNGDWIIFNGFTSPGWIMATVWLLFWGVVTVFFEDVQETAPSTRSTEPTEKIGHQPSPPQSREQPQSQEQPRLREEPRLEEEPRLQEESLNTSSTQISLTTRSSGDADGTGNFVAGPKHWAMIFTISWFAMTCFFILGSWEANIPIFAGSSESSLNYTPFQSGNLIAIGGAITFPFLLANLFVGKRLQDRLTLAAGTSIGTIGMILFIVLLAKSPHSITFATLLVSWMFVTLGFNLATTCTLSLLSKKLPGEWNRRVSFIIQCSNYTGRVCGAIWGGSGIGVGMKNYVGLQLAIVGVGCILLIALWRDLKAKTG